MRAWEAAMIVKNKKFRNTFISLDGGTFEKCTFEKCKMIYSGYLPVSLIHCTYGPDLEWSFDGPAANTIAFMRGLYESGATQLIENTFESIRGKPPKSGPTLH